MKNLNKISDIFFKYKNAKTKEEEIISKNNFATAMRKEMTHKYKSNELLNTYRKLLELYDFTTQFKKFNSEGKYETAIYAISPKENKAKTLNLFKEIEKLEEELKEYENDKTY